MPGNCRIFSTTGTQSFAQVVCGHMSMQLEEVPLGRFPDREVKYLGNIPDVRGNDCFVIGTIQTPEANISPETNIFELMFIARALRNASAGNITLVIPYLGYNRQDRPDKDRTATSAALVFEMLKLSGAHRLLLIDVHSDATLGTLEALGMVYDHIHASHTLVPYAKEHLLTEQTIICSPDKGGGPRARKYAQLLGIEGKIAFFDKARGANGDVEEVVIIGDVAEKRALFVDDITDTSGTLIADAEAAVTKGGATGCDALIVHGVLSADAIERIEKCPYLDRVIITDTIARDYDLLGQQSSKIVVVSVARQFAQAVTNLTQGKSLRELR